MKKNEWIDNEKINFKINLNLSDKDISKINKYYF